MNMKEYQARWQEFHAARRKERELKDILEWLAFYVPEEVTALYDREMAKVKGETK